MPLEIYNTATRTVEEFKPIEKGKVGIYSCGPTVYDFAHIGNFRAYVTVDLLKRYLKYKGFQVKHVMNITDVEDKIIKRSKDENRPFQEITGKFTEEFFKDLEALNIDKADVFPKATEYIEQMISIIQELIKKGIAYKSDDGSIYYNIKEFKGYGKLAHLQLDNLKAGARVKQDSYDKDNAQDFALWKAYHEDDGNVYWETPLGKGRPGWHIECSAMSMSNLGEHFDIHAGGIDLVFPHHENEIAQSEGCTGKHWVNYWFHNEHLLVDGKKMSKSLDNFFTLRDILKKGHKASSVRYLLLSAHYRTQLNFTEEGIHASAQAVERINEFARKLHHIKNEKQTDNGLQNIITTFKSQFEQAMDDDLNISQALSHLFEFIREINGLIDKGQISTQDAKEILNPTNKIDTVLGIIETQEETLPQALQALIDKREEARKDKDFQTADKLRDELKEKGIGLIDTKDGVQWKRNP